MISGLARPPAPICTKRSRRVGALDRFRRVATEDEVLRLMAKPIAELEARRAPEARSRPIDDRRSFAPLPDRGGFDEPRCGASRFDPFRRF